jgi:hypothetical protein
MNNSPSCLSTGPGGGKPGNRRSPLAPFPGQLAPRLYGHMAGAPRARHRRDLVTPTTKGFVRVGPHKS